MPRRLRTGRRCQTVLVQAAALQAQRDGLRLRLRLRVAVGALRIDGRQLVGRLDDTLVGRNALVAVHVIRTQIDAYVFRAAGRLADDHLPGTLGAASLSAHCAGAGADAGAGTGLRWATAAAAAAGLALAIGQRGGLGPACQCAGRLHLHLHLDALGEHHLGGIVFGPCQQQLLHGQCRLAQALRGAGRRGGIAGPAHHPIGALHGLGAAERCLQQHAVRRW